MMLKYHRVAYGILVLLVVAFAAPAKLTAADPSYRVYADSISAGRGEDVALRFSLSNQYAITSLTVPLSYDTDLLTLKSVSFTGSRVEYMANKLVSPADLGSIDGHFMVSAFTLFEDPLAAGDGLAFTLVFTVNPAAPLATTAVIDTLFFPPGGNLVVVRAGQAGAIHPLFTAGKITIGEPNRSPVFSAIPDQYVLEGDSLRLDVTVTDPDHDALTLAITSKPAGAVFTDHGDGTARFAWAPDYVGPNSADGSPRELSFWASDGDLASKQDLKVYVINRNRAPQVNGPAEISVEAGDPMQFSISALDPDFEAISWTVANKPAAAQFDAANPGHFSWHPAITDFGQSTVRFIAVDPQGLKDTLDVNLTVRQIALYTISLDSVSGLPGATVDFSVGLDNKLPVSSFNVLFNVDPSALSLSSIEAAGTRAESFEYFNVTHNDKGVPGNVRLVGVADIGGSGHLDPGEGPIATGHISISGDLAYAGLNIPLYFQNQDAPVNNDNTLTDSAGTKIARADIYYIPGDVQVLDIGEIMIGDINLNRIPAEIGDVIYFTNFFINPLLYSFDILQYANSDVNQDGIPASVSDLVGLINWVVTGHQPGKTAPSSGEGEAVIWQRNETGSLTIGFESDVVMGGVLLTLRTAPEMPSGSIISLADDMSLLYHQAGDETHILMYSLDGVVLPSGRTALVTIADPGDAVLTAVQLGSSDGRLVRAELEVTRDALPAEFTLGQNYPNPFNPETSIEFSLPVASDVELTIYNVLGQRVRSLVDGLRPAGAQRAVWNGCDDRGQRVSSGVYFYRLTSGSNTITRKMMLLK